jgi:enolase-phosphatase E1
VAPPGASAQAILLDIEGTTTPVAFVYDTLFPYTRRRLTEFLERHSGDPGVQSDLARLWHERQAERSEDEPPPSWHGSSIAAAAAYVGWIMDRDRKSTALKALQGRIWEEGYRSGELRGLLYEDVPRAFERWRRQGKAIAIFSSGSVLAQKLLFANSGAGDLTGYLRGFYDTTTGGKREAQSYGRIAADLACPAASMLFVSDVAAELDAARGAGMQTALCVREAGEADASAHPMVRSFDQISP